MKYDEVVAGLTELLKNPDTALAGAQDFLDKIKPDYETLDSLTQKVADDDKRIRDLQDTNHKLFLSQTGQSEETKEEEEPEEVTPETIAKEMFAEKGDN